MKGDTKGLVLYREKRSEKEMCIDNMFDVCFMRTHAVGGGIGKNPLLGYEINSERIKAHRPKVASILEELPKCFGKPSGFNLGECRFNKEGDRWTSDPRIVNRLICLGIAMNMIEVATPPEGTIFVRRCYRLLIWDKTHEI